MRIKTIVTTALCIALGGAACSRGKPPQYPLASSARAPAAQGNVDVVPEPNGNTRIAIKVKHLAPPASISARATTYVAWIVPRGSVSTVAGANQPADPDPINVGALTVDADLNGILETTTPYQQFDLIITPEPSAVAMRPSSDPVLTARIQER